MAFYKVVFNGPTMWECVIEIMEGMVEDTDGKPVSIDLIVKQVVEFWPGWQDRLADNRGCYKTTFVQMVARKVHYSLCRGARLSYGIFDGEPGWVPMDGRFGIRLLHADSFEFSCNDYVVAKMN